MLIDKGATVIKSKYYCRPFRLKKVNDKWIEEEYKPDRNAVTQINSKMF